MNFSDIFYQAELIMAAILIINGIDLLASSGPVVIGRLAFTSLVHVLIRLDAIVAGQNHLEPINLILTRIF